MSDDDDAQDLIPFIDLPDEIIIRICYFLPYIDYESIKKTCRKLFKLLLPRPRSRVYIAHTWAKKIACYDLIMNEWSEVMRTDLPDFQFPYIVNYKNKIYFGATVEPKSGSRYTPDNFVPFMMRINEDGDRFLCASPIKKYTNRSACVISDMLYLAGGFTIGYSHDDVDIYDFETNIWCPGPKLRWNAHTHKVVAVGQHTLYSIGGEHGNRVQRLDVRTVGWERVADMCLKRDNFGATTLNDNSILTVGGEPTYLNHLDCISECEIYDVCANKWRKCPSLPYKRAGCTTHCVYVDKTPDTPYALTIGGYVPVRATERRGGEPQVQKDVFPICARVDDLLNGHETRTDVWKLENTFYTLDNITSHASTYVYQKYKPNCRSSVVVEL